MRPAFFGEVVFPKSRAVDVDFGDDFEEELPPRNEVVLEPKADISKIVSSIKHLIIASGYHPSNFAQVHLIPDQPKADVVFTIKIFRHLEATNDEAGQEPLKPRVPTSVLDFYFVSGASSLVGITVSKYAPLPEAATAVTTKIFNHLAPIASSIRVLVLDFKPSQLYQTFDRASIEDRLSTYGIVRVLLSSKEKADYKDKMINLEVPNMVDGLAGAVMTHCEIKDVRAQTVVLYGPDSVESVSSNITVYQTSLESIELWSKLFSKEDKSITKAKLEALLRNTVPLASIFG